MQRSVGDGVEDVEKIYVESVLPGKTKYNLRSVLESNFWEDIRTMLRTVFAILGKDSSEEII